MIRTPRFYVLLVMLLCAAGTLSAQPPALGRAPMPKINYLMAGQTRLDNGLRVVVLPNPKLPRVSFQFFTDIPINREGERAGLTELTRQAMALGSTRHSAGAIATAVEAMGGQLYDNGLGFFGTAPTRHRDTLLALMADLMMRPAFDPAAFKTLIQRQADSLALREASPAGIADNVAQVLNHGKEHPYGELLKSTARRAFPLAACRKHYNEEFKPELTLLVVVGDITQEEAVALAKHHLGAWKQGLVFASSFKHPGTPASTKVAFVPQEEAARTHLRITYPLPALRPGVPREQQARLLAAILEERVGERLQKELALTPDIQVALQSNREVGTFRLVATVPTAATKTALAGMLHEMRRLSAERVDSTWLAQVKWRLAGQWLRGLQHPETLAAQALWAVRYRLPADANASYLTHLDSISPDDLLAAAKSYILPSQAYLVVVGDKGLADSLSALGPLHYYDLHGEEQWFLAMDEPEPITAEGIVERYVAALGPRALLDTLTDLSLVYQGEIQGMEFTMTIERKRPGKVRIRSRVSNLVLSDSRYDGERGVTSDRTGRFLPVDPNALPQLRHQGQIFPELHYEELGYKVTMGSPEVVGGKSFFSVVMSNADGINQTDTFDPDTGLKIRTAYTQRSPSGMVSVVNEYGDYREVGGLMVPGRLRIAGSMPIPLELSLREAKVNSGLDDGIFGG